MKPAELRAWRAQAGLTQPQLARLLGVHVMTVWQYEHSYRHTDPPLLRHLTVQRLEELRKEQSDSLPHHP